MLAWSSAQCENQGYVIGPHVGMQCHIEMTRELVETWCETGAGEIEEARGRSPAVQTPEEMRVDIAARVDALHRVAESVYDRWITGLEVNP